MEQSLQGEMYLGLGLGLGLGFCSGDMATFMVMVCLSMALLVVGIGPHDKPNCAQPKGDER